MKNLCFLSMFILLIFVCSLSNAQQTTAKLNQQELMNKFLGSWQATPANDTIWGFQIEEYGKAYLASDFTIIKGIKTLNDKWLIGYSKSDEKFRMFGIFESGGYLTRIASFVSENKFVQLMVRDFNTSRINGSVEFVFNTPSSINVKFLDADSKVTEEATLVKSQ